MWNDLLYLSFMSGVVVLLGTVLLIWGDMRSKLGRLALWAILVISLLVLWWTTSIIWPEVIPWIGDIQFEGIFTRYAPNWYHWMVLVIMGAFSLIIILVLGDREMREACRKDKAISFMLAIGGIFLSMAYQAAHNIWPGILPGL